MGFWQIELACALGVIVSFVFPVLRKAARKAWPDAADGGAISEPLMKYFVLLAFSVVTTLLITFLLQDQLTTSKAAFLVGYAWDSTIEKLTGRS